MLHEKAYNITCNPQYNGYQSAHASMFYKLLVKRVKRSDGAISDTATSTLSQKLADVLQKTIIKKIQKHVKYIHDLFNIWGTDPPDIQLTSRCYKGIRFFNVCY